MTQQRIERAKWLGNLMLSYQTAVADVLEDAGFVVPERSLVAFNLPAWDQGDQLTVHLGSAYVNNPGVRPDTTRLDPRKVKSPAVKIIATLLRPVVGLDLDGQIPEFQALNEEALDLYAQAWAVWFGVLERLNNGTLFDYQPEPRWDKPEYTTLVMGDLQLLGPQGEIAGFAVPVVVSLGA